MGSNNHFEIINLCKYYGSQVALKDLNLKIEKRSLNFLLGSNGSGKSTLLKCLAGHESWSSGDIYFNNQSRAVDRKNFNAGIHFISEDIVPPKASLKELRSVYQSIYPTWDEEIFQRFIAWSKLSLNGDLMSVSRGQKIQGLLALSLSVHPEVLIVDEATAVLDPFIRNRVVMEIERLNEAIGMTAIIATNIASEISGLKGRLCIMRDGNILVDGSSSLLGDGFSKIRVSPDYLDSAAKAGFSYLERSEDGTCILIGESSRLEHVEFKYLIDRRAISVEEVFIHFSDRESK